MPGQIVSLLIYQTFNKRTPILHTVFLKIEERILFSNSFYEDSIFLIPKPDKDQYPLCIQT